MQRRDLDPEADILDLFRATLGGAFPGQLWEAMMARLELGRR